jgi:hypothetical protein
MVALLTGAAIAVTGVTIVNHTRVDVAESAITAWRKLTSAARAGQ